MKPLNIAVIGQGRSGRDIHCANLQFCKDIYNIVAVVDRRADRRERAVREFGCEAYADYTELFGRTDIDLVVNASYSQMHAPITLELLKHGFNVVCEKPFAQTAAEVDEMIAAERASGKRLFVFQQSRFAPYFEKIKEVIASGKLGRIVQISIAFSAFARRWDWQCVQGFTAGSLYNTGPHPLDQALRLLDVEGMPNVLCRMDRVNTYGDAEDYVKLILTAKDRPLIDIEISSCDAYVDNVYKIHAEHGSLKGGADALKFKYFKPEEAPTQNLVVTSLMNDDGTPQYCGEKLTWYEEEWKPEEGNLFKAITTQYYEKIYDTLVNGADFPITLAQVRQQIAVIEECHRQNPLPAFVTAADQFDDGGGAQ